jgi:hypothetical protein
MPVTKTPCEITTICLMGRRGIGRNLVVLQKRRVEKNLKQRRRTMPIHGRGTILFLSAAFLLFCFPASFGAPPNPPKNAPTDSNNLEADTSKVVVSDDYFEGSEKKSALFDSSGRQLSTQQMVDFLKNELGKLNEQITAIVQRSGPDTQSASEVNDVDVMKLVIIKGKLESMEKMLDEWTKQRTQEASSSEESPAVPPPPKSSHPRGKK